MKNIYELTSKEKDSYRSEFNKLESTKKINKKRFLSLSLLFFGGIVIGIFECLIAEGYTFLEEYTIYAIIITIAVFIDYLFYEINSRISFARWLKIKHSIEY